MISPFEGESQKRWVLCSAWGAVPPTESSPWDHGGRESARRGNPFALWRGQTAEAGPWALKGEYAVDGCWVGYDDNHTSGVRHASKSAPRDPPGCEGPSMQQRLCGQSNWTLRPSHCLQHQVTRTCCFVKSLALFTRVCTSSRPHALTKPAALLWKNKRLSQHERRQRSKMWDKFTDRSLRIVW